VPSTKSYVEASEKKTEIKYPSSFGSHSSMIDEEASKKVPVNLVVCKDADGLYVTEKAKLDTGLYDHNRNTSVKFRKEELNKFTLP